jgi:hypothetical protein
VKENARRPLSIADEIVAARGVAEIGPTAGAPVVDEADLAHITYFLGLLGVFQDAVQYSDMRIDEVHLVGRASYTNRWDTRLPKTQHEKFREQIARSMNRF